MAKRGAPVKPARPGLPGPFEHQSLEHEGLSTGVIAQRPGREPEVRAGHRRVRIVGGGQQREEERRVVAEHAIGLGSRQREQRGLEAVGPELAVDAGAGGVARQVGELVALLHHVEEGVGRGIEDGVVDRLRAQHDRQRPLLLERVDRHVDVLALNVHLVGVEAAALVGLHGVRGQPPHEVDLELGRRVASPSKKNGVYSTTGIHR